MKRPYLQYSVPSLEVVIDERGWLPTFNRVFYELPFPEFPFKFPGPGFFIANGWSNGEGTFNQKIRIMQPDKEKVLSDSGSKAFELKNAESSFVGVNFFKDVVFEKPGLYWIQVLLNEDLVMEYPLIVRLRDGAEGKTKETPAIAEKPAEPKKQEAAPAISTPIKQAEAAPAISTPIKKVEDVGIIAPKEPGIKLGPSDDMGIIAPGG